MEQAAFAQYLIYTHAALGGIALLAGGMALATRKGKQAHVSAGKAFFFSMLASALTSLVAACLPGHESPFLFSIGVFSSYLIVSGMRSVQFKRKDHNRTIDKVLAYGIILTGVAMIVFPMVAYKSLNLVLLFFGLIGLGFGVRDLLLLRKPAQIRRSWLILHLTKMTGGYIAAITAFFVVNQILPGMWNWFVPSILGSGYIAYWVRKVKPKKVAKKAA